MKTENKTTLVAFLSDLNYAIDLTATDLDAAKNEAAALISSKTAKVQIYKESADSEELTPMSYADVYADDPLAWNDF